MKPIKITLWIALVGLTLLWLIASLPFPSPLSYFAFRDQFVQYSGIISIGMMSIAMLLAVRPVWIESYLNGLDKMYRLHKWLGISALIFSVMHWWMAKGTKWMVGWGWLERPTRRRPPGDGTQTQNTLESFINSQRGIAEFIGEWAFYIAALLLVLALIQRFPYRLFKQTHKWLAVIYLFLVYHALILVKAPYWGQPIGWVLIPLLAAGTVAAVLVLFKRVGVKRQVSGTLSSIHYYEDLKVLETTIQLEKGWPGHQAGQFAFINSHLDVGAHPYTIASAWDETQRSLTIIIKELGDHTKSLLSRLKIGQTVIVEGPYGRFTFQDNKPRQIWIGGGIGITPFIAQMKHLTNNPDGKVIDLFHATKEVDENALAKLAADAKAANINLHIFIEARDGYLTGEKLRSMVPDWQTASVWFCGPTAFAEKINADLSKEGLKATDFHQEVFSFR
ncbi:ferredoxin reductase family protein [Thiofilum flexile]|uniref:ferredoxin reductase family protein n=1 Tax=Thiofilum flexile TaxID=125627 RepID=UPI00035D255B|nr:ferric reductase-like transmembrane domain-containing protein [Thiofilum flexile]